MRQDSSFVFDPIITCRTRRPSSAKTDSQHLKNSSINSWPTASIISLKNANKDLVFFLGILGSDIIQWKRTLPGYDSVIFIGFRQLAVVAK